jgi:hypothetical protein
MNPKPSFFGKEITMPGRERNIQIKFRVTAEERKIITEKMRLLHTNNLAAYLRKMALDGVRPDRALCEAV